LRSCAYDPIDVFAQFAVVLALVPTRRAERRRGVEDGDAERATVEERTTEVVHRLRVLAEQGGAPAAHVVDRIYGWRRGRLRNDLDHQRHHVVMDSLDGASAGFEWLNEPEG
jgi:hypothetical protein